MMPTLTPENAINHSSQFMCHGCNAVFSVANYEGSLVMLKAQPRETHASHIVDRQDTKTNLHASPLSSNTPHGVRGLEPVKPRED